jgi:hypothetical protein
MKPNLFSDKVYKSEERMKSQTFFASRWLIVKLVLVAGVGLLLLAACSGGSGAAKADASKADIGKSVEADNWKVTLKGIPDSQEIVGGSGISHQAENGKYIIIPAEVTNIGQDLVLFPNDLIFLKDSTGKQWPLASSTPQFAYKQNHPEVDILMDSPVSPGQMRKTVLIFDVAPEAAGFELVIPKQNAVFKLGY